MSTSGSGQPQVSVVISNQNGTKWLPRCFEALRRQTVARDLEVIMVDNVSADDSVEIARKAVAQFPWGKVIQNPKDLGFTGGNNAGAEAATAPLIFFLSNDTWLEPDCIEKLLGEFKAAGADAACPVVLDYDSVDTFQSIGSDGIDLCGIPNTSRPMPATGERFTIVGCGFLIRRDLFLKLGEFDLGHFMYAEETDLSWRVWIAGGKIVGVPSARMHHRPSVTTTTVDGESVAETRTSETKRFLANRNGMLIILKNSQHILLLLLLPYLLMLFLEMLASAVLVRRWGYIRKAYLGAVTGAFGMLGHVRQWRRRIRGFRQRGDFWMLRFLRLKPSRWDEAMRLLKIGVPKVEKR